MDSGAISAIAVVMVQCSVLMKLMLCVINLVGVELATTLPVNMLGMLYNYYSFLLSFHYRVIDPSPITVEGLRCFNSRHINIFQCNTGYDTCADNSNVYISCCESIVMA